MDGLFYVLASTYLTGPLPAKYGDTGNACERRRWRIQRAGVGAAVEILQAIARIKDFGHRKRGAPASAANPAHDKWREQATLRC